MSSMWRLMADPLYPNFATSGGSFPSCTGYLNTAPAFSCTGTLPTFDNIKNGAYRVWSTIRAVIYQSYTAPASGPSVYQLIQAAQDQAHVNIQDMVPSVYCSNSACSSTTVGMPSFRSHYPVSGKSANNGTTSPSTGYCASDQTAPNCIEEGGDMAGKPFYNIQDQEFYSLTGNELLTWIQ